MKRPIVLNTGDPVARSSRVASPRRKEKNAHSLSIELLDTRHCLDLLPQINDFENSVFGPDFAVAPERMETWAQSGCWFCAAVTGQAVLGRRRILSMISVLVTTNDSRENLLAGTFSESQLRPWTEDPLNHNPAIYFASVISSASEHLGSMYEGLARELRDFKSRQQVEFHSGFGIASGPAGFNHMAANGFRFLEGYNYRRHYPIMVIDAQSAATRFWSELLSGETIFFKRRRDEQPEVVELFPTAIAS